MSRWTMGVSVEIHGWGHWRVLSALLITNFDSQPIPYGVESLYLHFSFITLSNILVFRKGRGECGVTRSNSEESHYHTRGHVELRQLGSLSANPL